MIKPNKKSQFHIQLFNSVRANSVFITTHTVHAESAYQALRMLDNQDLLPDGVEVYRVVNQSVHKQLESI